MSETTCAACGVAFFYVARTKPRRFCSRECGLAFHRPKKAAVERSCVVCSGRFSSAQPAVLTCSRECSHQHRRRSNIQSARARRATQRDATVASRRCRHCGAQIERRKLAYAIYCGSACKKAAWRLANPARAAAHRAAEIRFCAVRPCDGCGKYVAGNRKRCAPCATQRAVEQYKLRLLRSRLQRAEQRATVQRTCSVCAAAFTPEKYRGQRFCSDGCARVHARSLPTARAARAANKAKRKALYRHASERFDPREIFERDGWRCGICRKPVNKDAKVPDAKAATLDHIVPLAHGGEHSRSNVQLAHFLCNSRKSHHGGGQLKLGV